MTNDTKPDPIGEVIIGEDSTGLSKDKWTVVRWREGAPPIAVGTKLYDEAALNQARAVPETAWLVEWKDHGYGPQWWGFDYEPRKRGSWCSDANNAIRFARKEDAERMRVHIIAVDGLTGNCSYERSISVTEHEWCDGRASALTAPSPAAQPAQMPLTDEQIAALPDCGEHVGSLSWLRRFARAIEAAHHIGTAPTTADQPEGAAK